MKNKLFSITFLCFFVSVIFFDAYGQVTFAIKSGINIATVKDLIAYPKNRVGWYAGGVIEVPFNKKTFFRPELLYSSKGYGVDQEASDIKAVRINYLNLPILFGYRIDNKTSLLLGPELGYFVSGKSVLSDATFDNSKSLPVKFDIALDLGAVYLIKKRISAEVRYSYGFKTFYSIDAQGGRHSLDRAGNRVFQVGVICLLTSKPK